MTQAAPTTELVFGWVDRYRLSKGFGFAGELPNRDHPIIGRGSVFLHSDNCFTFEGTPEQPSIGAQPVNHNWLTRNMVPARFEGGRNSDHSFVMMRTAIGDRGPYATEWTVIPRRKSLDDVLQFNGLDWYMGMEVAILPTAQNSSECVWGALAAYSLTDNRLSLTLASPRGEGRIALDVAEVVRELDFRYLTVSDDTLRQLILKLTMRDRSTVDVICWRRPPN